MGFTRKKRTEAQWEATGPEILRCTAHLKSDGSQCRWEAAPGTNVCNQHGALIPAVQAKAAARIQMSVDDAVKRLLQMIDDPNTDNRDKIKVLHDLLDRGGLGATSKHLVGVVSQDPVEALFASILSDPRALEQPSSPAPEPDSETLALNAKVLEDDDELDSDELLGPVVDAEVVEDEPDSPTFTQRPALHQRPVSRRSKPKGDPLPPKHIREDLKRLGLL